MKGTGNSTLDASPTCMAGFGIGMLLIVVAAAVSTISHLAHQQARDTLCSVLSQLQDTGTGQRGHIITDDGRYLETYHEATASVAPDMDRLAQFTAGNQHKGDTLYQEEMALRRYTTRREG